MTEPGPAASADSKRAVARGASTTRYSTIAIVLHWTIALALIALLAAGWWMTDAIKQAATRGLAFQVYQLHKSLGLTVLVLSSVRLLWRLVNPPPPLPESMTSFERTAARATHWLFYALTIGMPLAGWAMVSASPLGLPTIVFGQFEWPHIGWLAGLEQKAAAEALFKTAHRYMGYGLVALIALHVAAALKHHVIDRDDVLARMLPLVRRA